MLKYLLLKVEGVFNFNIAYRTMGMNDMEKKSEICKLCLREVQVVGKLRKSHVIPRFILLKSKDRSGQTVVYNGKGKARISQFDWKEYMLCGECEARMKWHEDFLNDVFYSRKNKNLRWVKDNHNVHVANSSRIVLAFISIFWRSIVAKNSEFQLMAAPDYVSETFRSWLISRSLDKNWDKLISMRIINVLGDGGMEINMLCTPFFRWGEAGLRGFEFVFIFGGYCCIFELPPPENGVSKRFSVKNSSNILRVERIHYGSLPELREMVNKMLEANAAI